MSCSESGLLAVFGSDRLAANIIALGARNGCPSGLVGHSIRDTTRFIIPVLDDLAAAGMLTVAERESALEHVVPFEDDTALREAETVVEAVEDTVLAKAGALSYIDALAPTAVLATTTALRSVTAIAGYVTNPERVGGLHFVEPAHLNPIVEVVRAQRTSPETIGKLTSLAERLGKQPIVVKDRPGFLVQRLLVPYLNDVIQCYDDGLASARDLDVALELGLGYPRGPLTVLGDIGLDVHQTTARALHEALDDPHFAPPPLLDRMVDAKELDAAAGHGFQEDATRSK